MIIFYCYQTLKTNFIKLKIRILYFILLFPLLSATCEDNNEPTSELNTFLCCGDNPFVNENIDNLDQSLGEIKIHPLITPNNDGVNDLFMADNIGLYNYNSVTIFDLDNNIIFQTENYHINSNDFYDISLNMESGTYKYKVVVENEETFLEYGYVCLLRNREDSNGFSFLTECSGKIDPDPIIN